MMGLREIQKRKKAVDAISRMTGAITMMSRVKFSRCQNLLRNNIVVEKELRMMAGRLLFEGQKNMPSLYHSTYHHHHTLNTNHDHYHPSSYLFHHNIKKPSLLVVFTGNTGMCGGFHQSILKKAQQYLSIKKDTRIILVGKKGLSFLEKYGTVESHEYPGDGLLHHILDLWHHKQIGRCDIVAGKFFNILKQEPTTIDFLPFSLECVAPGHEMERGIMALESSFERVFDQTMNLLICSYFRLLQYEHMTSEHASRMTSMDAATENAKKMIDSFQLTYNRLRQSIITKELIEIISGSNTEENNNM